MLRKIGFTLLVITILAGLAVSCTPKTENTTLLSTSTSTPTITSITVTDHYNRTVTIKKYPQRIVSLSPAQTEILFALGLGARIVGVSDYSDYPPEAKNIPSIGSYDTPNIEEIIAKEPDLVLATMEHTEQMAELESHGLAVVGTNPTTVSEVLSTITLIGQITGADEAATKLVADLQQRINAITEKTKSLPDEQRLRVFYIIWNDPIWTVGSETFHDELIQMAGGLNITHHLTGYVDISLEAVIDANPQVIIAGVGMGTGGDSTLKFVQTDDRFSEVDARVNNRIYGADMDIISRPGPRLVEALENFLADIHPELRNQP